MVWANEIFIWWTFSRVIYLLMQPEGAEVCRSLTVSFDVSSDKSISTHSTKNRLQNAFVQSRLIQSTRTSDSGHIFSTIFSYHETYILYVISVGILITYNICSIQHIQRKQRWRWCVNIVFYTVYTINVIHASVGSLSPQIHSQRVQLYLVSLWETIIIIITVNINCSPSSIASLNMNSCIIIAKHARIWLQTLIYLQFWQPTKDRDVWKCLT